MIGIYKITNKINNKCYIGQSLNIKRRWQDEKRTAFDSIATNYQYPLSKAFRKYGIDNFQFEIIEECSKEKLNEREKYWISYYDGFFNGYNQTLGGDNHNNKPKETIIGIITDLKTTNLYHREIAEKWDVSMETVQGINTGRYWFSSEEQYPLQERCKKIKESTPKKWFCVDCGIEISHDSKRCRNCADKAKRKVIRPTKEELSKLLIESNGNFSKIGKYFRVSDSAIRKWCDAYNLPRLSKQWKEIIKRNHT